MYTLYCLCSMNSHTTGMHAMNYATYSCQFWHITALTALGITTLTTFKRISPELHIKPMYNTEAILCLSSSHLDATVSRMGCWFVKSVRGQRTVVSICDFAVWRSADILIIFDTGKRRKASVWEKTAYNRRWVIKLSKWEAYDMKYVGVSMMSNKK